jgi:hypothetical protein
MQGDAARMRGAAMFPNVNPLPGSQREAAILKRNAEVHGRQRRADVRGHVVVTFRRVDENRVTIAHETGEKTFEIPPDIRIRILLDQQGRGGMSQMQRDEAVVEIVFCDPAGYVIGEFL